jgi:peptidoglycan LD-endopeptidase LytH
MRAHGSSTQSDGSRTGAPRVTRRPWRPMWMAIVVAALIAPAVSRADDGSTTAEQAAQEIADARSAANRAADDVFAAESKVDVLQVQQDQLASQVGDLQAQVAKLKLTIQGAAVNRFTRSGTDAQPLLTGFRPVGDQAQVDVLMGIADETSADDFDHFDEVTAKLADAQRRLGDLQSQTIAAKAEFAKQKSAAEAQIVHLKAVEAAHLQDDAARRAMIAEGAELQRLQAVAAQQPAAPTSSVVLDLPSAVGETTTTIVDALGEGDVGGVGDTASQASGGIAGGKTGLGGLGARPGPTNGDDYGSPTWVCPLQTTAMSFSDTWGAPRSGGRKHEGVDMIADKGTPIVAVVDGFAQQSTNVLGGNTIEFTGADGNRYYYAHLDSWASLGQVVAGTVIGYVGQTGDAQESVPHLHFEIHPGGGPAVDPYPTVRAHCV